MKSGLHHLDGELPYWVILHFPQCQKPNCPFLQSLKHLVSAVNFHKSGKYLQCGKMLWMHEFMVY